MVNSRESKIFLKDFISDIKPDLIERLKIFIALCVEIRRFHANHMVHNDISIDVCHIDPATSTVEILGSNLALDLTERIENNSFNAVGAIDGQLAYIAPERTGKTAYSVDYRSDLYSLGVVFYQLLTDALPFNSKQPLELIHAHIALAPIPVEDINSEIPQILSQIVSKLLAKSPTDRYQNIAGLIFDLKKVLKQLQAKDNLENFPLAQRDFSPFFEIPDKLYGRYREVQLICDTYKQISHGKIGVVFISGPPGIGKTFLVKNIQPFLLEEGGLFISGKFDQYEKKIPYSAVSHAFSGVIKQILTLSDAAFEERRIGILKAVGKNGQLIIDLIPELELVIGKQPKPEKLSGLKNRNRFNYLFQKFAQAITAKAGPVIIFLDDLQWADQASLELLEAIILEPVLSNVLFIGAYREIEAKENTFLADFFKGFTRHPILHKFIALEPVDDEYIKMLIKDMFSIDMDPSSRFIQLVAQKTNRNPLFIREFLISLNKEGLIRFVPAQRDIETGRWQIDLDGIFKAKLPETIVALLTQRIGKLTRRTQEILEIAACIGNNFSLDLLKMVYQRSVKMVFAHLKEAIDQGIIVRNETGFGFIHDHLREAVYQSIRLEKRTRTHCLIGKTLMLDASTQQSNNIFLLVLQLNSAHSLLSADERFELIKFNLSAGKKAKKITAFTIANDYFVTGLTLFDEFAWQKHYDLALALHTEAAETAYMCADFAEAENLIQAVLQNAHTDLDKVAALGIRLSCLASQKRFFEVMDEGVDTLRYLGYRLPKNPGKLRLLWELMAMKWSLRRKNKEDLWKINYSVDSKTLVQNHIISSIRSIAYRTRPNIFKYIVLNGLRSSLKRGSGPDTAVYFAFYGLLLGTVGKMDRGYDFGQLALELSNHPKINPTSKTQILLPVNGIMLIWKKHFKETLKPLLETYKFCMETGNLTEASGAIAIYFNNSLACGTPLAQVIAEIDHYYDIMSKSRQQSALDYLIELRHLLVSNFIGSDHCAEKSKYIGFDKNASFERSLKYNDKPALAYAYFSKLIGSYYEGNYSNAIENAELTSNILKKTPPSVINIRLRFYDSLARLALISDSKSNRKNDQSSRLHSLKFFCFKRYHLAKVTANQKEMKLWSRHSPMNLLSKWNLVEAEKCRFFGQKRLAEAHYHKAIALSEKYGFLQEQALANELLARFYLAFFNVEAARGPLNAAIDLYRKWGAEILRLKLLGEYQQLFARKAKKPQDDKGKIDQQHHLESQKGLTPAEMNLQLFSDVLETISAKISAKKRLISLSQHLMQYTGARRVLLLMKKERLFVGVDNEIGKKPYALKPVKDDLIFPATIIQYVIRTREILLLDHVAETGMFSNDPYSLNHKPKSIICIPLTYQGKLQALLYFENNLSNGVFTRQHLEILTRLGGQIALFLENEFFKQSASVDGRGFLLPDQLIIFLQDHYGLTPQEAKIATLFRDGHTRDQICNLLSISATTLRKHLQTIFNKTVNLEEKYSGEGRVDKLSRLILFLFKQTDMSF